MINAVLKKNPFGLKVIKSGLEMMNCVSKMMMCVSKINHHEEFQGNLPAEAHVLRRSAPTVLSKAILALGKLYIESAGHAYVRDAQLNRVCRNRHELVAELDASPAPEKQMSFFNQIIIIFYHQTRHSILHVKGQ